MSVTSFFRDPSKRSSHTLKGPDSLLDVCKPFLREPLHVSRGRGGIRLQRHQLPNLLEGESELLRAFDKPQV